MMSRHIEQGLAGSVCTRTSFLWEVTSGIKKARQLKNVLLYQKPLPIFANDKLDEVGLVASDSNMSLMPLSNVQLYWGHKKVR